MTGSESQERHLLFGLLAFQNEFISHEALLKAFSTWVGDKSKSLDEILVAQEALSAEDRQLFNRLVEKHLAKFDGDATQSLTNLSDVGSVREELERLAEKDTGVLATLSHLPTPQIQLSEFQTILGDEASTVAKTVQPTSTNRFRIVRQHARGGLGVVFVAEDQDLRREVAMKQIRDDRADFEAYRTKFMAEAEVTGQLEHPGIVPVYALGTDPKGRPYYAMRFVRGEDLQSRIRTFHANRRETRSEFDGSELRGLLRRFVDVCNAIQYAHDRGVLHRDLKPGNVMLGKHGETLVVDWGLAKPFGEDVPLDPTATLPKDTESPVERSGTASGSETQAGTFIGTPAYAPPEQVLGQLEKLGPRSDVYSLGAVLYELLTGKVPVSGTTVAEVITKATTGNFPAPRTIDVGIPKPLEAICRKAMSVEVGDRYSSAEELCRDVEHWLDDSVVSAYNEPFVARVHRLVRKNPVTASWIAAGLLMAFLGAVGFGLITSNFNRQLVQKNEEIEQEKIAAENARDAEEIAKEDAQFARNQAVGVRDFLVDIFRQPDPSRDGRKVTVYDSMVAGVRRVRRDFVNDPETAVALLTSIYQSYMGLGLYSDADELINEVIELREEHGLQDEDGAIINTNDLGKNLKLLGKFGQSIRTHEKLYEKCLEERGPEDPLTLQVRHDLANAYRRAGRLQDALTANQQVYESRVQKLGADDEDTLSSQNTLANSLQAIGRSSTALELREQNFESRKTVLGPQHPDTLASQSNLAVSLLESGNLTRALTEQTQAFENRKEVLGLEHPDSLASLFNLANVLLELGRNDEAEKMYVDSIAGLKEALTSDHPSTLAAMSGHGRILERQGELNRAEEVLDAVYRSQKTSLGEEHPATLSSLNNLASVYERLGKVDEARDLLQGGVERATQSLGATHEITVDLQLTLQVVLFGSGQIDDGVALCEEVAPLTIDAFGDAHPKSIKAHNNLALAYYVTGELDKALAVYDKLELTQNMAMSPTHPETIRTALGSLHTLRDLGRFGEAVTRAELTLTRSRSALGNENALTLDLMNTLGFLYLTNRRPTDARTLFYEELQTRVKKFGLNDPSTVLAAGYLITTAERLKEWTLAETVAKKFLDELTQTEDLHMRAVRHDFAFRLGYARTKLGKQVDSSKSLMRKQIESLESFASPPAPPQLSVAEMKALLQQLEPSGDKAT